MQTGAEDIYKYACIPLPYSMKGYFVLQDFSQRISFPAAEISSELRKLERKIMQQGLRHSWSFKTSVCIALDLSEGPELCLGKKFSLKNSHREVVIAHICC